MIEYVKDDNLGVIIKESQKVIVRFYSNWSELCNAFTPHYNELAKMSSDALKFLDVDIAENPKSTASIGAFSLPFTAVYQEGELKERISNSNLLQFKELISRHTHSEMTN